MYSANKPVSVTSHPHPTFLRARSHPSIFPKAPAAKYVRTEPSKGSHDSQEPRPREQGGVRTQPRCFSDPLYPGIFFSKGVFALNPDSRGFGSSRPRLGTLDEAIVFSQSCYSKRKWAGDGRDAHVVLSGKLVCPRYISTRFPRGSVFTETLCRQYLI